MTTTQPAAMPELHRDQIIDLISPLSKNSADHDIEFANRVIAALTTSQPVQAGEIRWEICKHCGHDVKDPCHHNDNPNLARNCRWNREDTRVLGTGLVNNRPTQPAEQATPEPLTSFEDPRAQIVYDLLCSDEAPPPEQHWEGWVARRIVSAMQSQQSTQVDTPAAARVSDVIAMVREQYRGTKWGKAAECICDAVDEAILALRSQAVVAKAQVPMTDEQLCEALGIDGSDDWTYKVRDIVEAHHRITAQGAQGEQA